MPTETWKSFTCYLAARARETSTWQALVVLLTLLGVKLSEEEKMAILTTGLIIAGALGAALPDRLGQQQTRSTD